MCGDGFPEFTRCFNHSFLWKLQLLQPAALPTELPGNGIQLKRVHCSTIDGAQGERFLATEERAGSACVYTSKSSVSSSSDEAAELPSARAA